MATVRRTDTEFQYQLVITRVYEEGEENLLDEDDESESGGLAFMGPDVIQRTMSESFC
jgi:hypothetical protein